MKITLAKHSGFCMGVKNAVLRIIHEINSADNELYMYGPLIHNPQTIAILQRRGLKTLHSLEEVKGGTIAIRTHGVPVEERRALKECAEKVINLTCTRVSKVQSIIKKYSAMGYYIVITGDKDHAEVVGLRSYARAGVSVISNIDNIGSIPRAQNYAVVSQTTFDRETFDLLVLELKKKFDSLIVFDTICDSTKLRQDDVIEGILHGHDTLVVIGGKNSANTKRLARIGEDNRIKTLHIETEDELKEEDFLSAENVLVTAGTSTPGWIINNVLEKLYAIKNKKSNLLLKSSLIGLEFIVRTNLLSAIAAFFICGIALTYAGVLGDYLFPIISFLYIFSMYSINNYFDREFLKLSNPYKYIIYKKFGAALLLISVFSMLASLYLARRYSPWTIALLGLSYILGFSYSARPMKQFVEKIRVKIIKRLYYSKIVACIGWIIVTVLLPLLDYRVGTAIIASLSAWVLALIFLRMLLLDLIAFQGDLIMGRETLPQWLGAKSISLVARGIGAAAILIFGYATFSLNLPHFLLFLLNIIYFLIIMDVIKKLNYIISLKYELLVDFNFILIAIFYFFL